MDLAELWAPVEGATAYFAASAYCTGATLRGVLDRLRAHRATVAEFTAVFFLSRDALDDRAWEVLASALAEDPLLAVFVLVGDRPPFHPKLVASAGPARARIVVGSANLTDAGLHHNREALVAVHDDPALWERLARSLRELLDDPGVVKVTSPRVLAEQRELARIAHTLDDGARAPYRALLELAGDDPEFRRALASLRRLVEGGLILLPPVELDGLSLSVPLRPYRELRVLAEMERDFIATGISWGGRRGSLSVSLLPDRVREACNRLSRQRSSLKGLYTADALGRAWMPAAWFPAFREKWAAIPFPLPELIAEAEQHEAELGAELDSDEVLARLRDTINVRPASAWRWTDDEGRPHDGLRELPELLDMPGLEHPVIARSRETGEVSPELRELVARGLRAWLKRCLRARIQTGYVRQRMAALGMEPAARPCLIADPVELVLIVNGWVMRAAMAELRVEGGASPRSMVGRVILEHLRGLGVDFEEVYRKTLGWQQGVARPRAQPDPTHAITDLHLMTNSTKYLGDVATGLATELRR